MRAGQRPRRKTRALITALLVIFLGLPLVWTALASLGIRTEVPSADNPPAPPSLDHFLELGLAEQGFWRELATSALLSSISAALTIAAALPATYSLLRFRPPRGRQIAQLSLVLASLPLMAYIIPLEETLRAFRLGDSMMGLAVAQAALLSPLAVYLLFGGLRSSPVDVEEAARLEGARAWRILLHMVLPMNVGIVASVGILVLALDWNGYLAPLVLTGGRVRTLPLGLSDFLTSDRELEWPTAAAALIVAFSPLLLLVAIALRGFGEEGSLLSRRKKAQSV